MNVISGHHRLVAVITNNYTTGSVAKIKSDDFEFPLEEFIEVDEKLQILSDVLEPARNSKINWISIVVLSRRYLLLRLE